MHQHDPFEHCPIEKDVNEEEKCHCNPEKAFDFTWVLVYHLGFHFNQKTLLI
ncbi:hypothetical protein RhiirA4_456741 [Rhizophagus irregularis]|uniref:Uncharacterized protein n=1 Tax=Rhizophagus irregularis TaxID=588596 RepID=A0A2I1G883_9GLOM|nr:hypothetical protein RhiirA4_456741 [Rhizophagus irregularis]